MGLEITNFSNCNDASLDISTVPSGTGLIVVYISNGAITSLSLNGGSGLLYTIESPTATYTVADGIASIWVIQNALNVETIVPNITGESYASAVVYALTNDVDTPWSIVGVGSSASAPNDPTVHNRLQGPLLSGVIPHDTSQNLYIAVVGNQEPATAVYPWTQDLSDANGVFAHYIGQGNQQLVTDDQIFGQPLAAAGIVIDEIIPTGAASSATTGSVASGGLKTVTVEVTSAEILALATTPKVLIAGQAGHIYVPQSFTAFYKPVTKAYIDRLVYDAPLTLTSVETAVVTHSAALSDVEFPAPRATGYFGLAAPSSTEALITTPDAPLTGTNGLADLVDYATIGGFSNQANNGTFRVVGVGPDYHTQAVIQNINAVTESGASASIALAGSAIYHGTISGGAANAFVGQYFRVVGFANQWNNGLYICLSSTATALELANINASAETLSAATSRVSDSPVQQSFLICWDSNTGVNGGSYSSGRYGTAQTTNVTSVCGTMLPQVNPFTLASSPAQPNVLTGESILLALTNNYNLQPVNLEFGDGTLTVICQYYDFEV